MKKIRPYAPPFLQPFDFWPAFVLVLVAVGCAMVGQGLIALAVGAGAVVTLFFVSGRSDAACHQYREDYVLHLQQFSSSAGKGSRRPRTPGSKRTLLRPSFSSRILKRPSF